MRKCNYIIMLPVVTVLLTACMSKSGPYSTPGYYQPAQAQSPYIAAGFKDDMGNYHPPTEQSGGVTYGRWYRPQPGNPSDPKALMSPNATHAAKNPHTSYDVEVANMVSDGDDGTAL